MEVTLWHKFTQHKSLKKMILETGERPITFVSTPPGVPLFTYHESLRIDKFWWLGTQMSDVDSFWGTGRDGHGKNYLGRTLEKTRWRIKTCTPPIL
jgi:predicted NAD-dependent protein-ADP-ribosyltransferase YbiA (DUF1768 family)